MAKSKVGFFGRLQARRNRRHNKGASDGDLQPTGVGSGELDNASEIYNSTVNKLENLTLWEEAADVVLPVDTGATASPVGIDNIDSLTLSLPLMGKTKSTPVLSSVEIPIALVVLVALVRAYVWYVREQKSTSALPSGDGDASEALLGSSNREQNGHSSVRSILSSGSSSKHASVKAGSSSAALSEEETSKLKKTLEREAVAKQRLAQENETLQTALDEHKATVDKFQAELESRNERLSAFEQEQDTVRRDLSAQIEVLKQELVERQKQEQGNLQSKETLCHDLIDKITTLNKDLENHEKLWQGVASKAKEKESESSAKVDALQRTLKKEEAERAKRLQKQEEERASLEQKVQVLQSQVERQSVQRQQWEKTSGPSSLQQMEAALQRRLQQEKEHAQQLSTKLQVFSTELASRQDRVSTLQTKMEVVERMSSDDLKALQAELQAQVDQRAQLQKTAQDMTQLLEQKRDQCVQLSAKLEQSKKELKALDERFVALSNEVEKREALATARLQAMEKQVNDEREQKATCKTTVSTTNQDLVKKQEEFVMLTARMDLYLKELQFRDEQVASLESKLTAKEDLATSEIKELRQQLKGHQERRDEWNAKTEELNQLLKDKKAQVVGLTTRADLFERELETRRESVLTLESRIREEQEAEKIKMTPFRNELQRLQAERKTWRQKTDEIERTLEEKETQVQGLKTRLFLFKQEVAKREEHVTILRKSFQEQNQKITAEMAPFREKLDLQREQRDSWTEKTADIERLLKEKRDQIVGLRVRVDLFQQELATKKKIVEDAESKVADKDETGSSSLAVLQKQLESATKGRDDWKESSRSIRDLLASKKQESAKLSVELKELVSDLQSYQHRRAALEERILHQKKVFEERQVTLNEELKVQEDYRDEWGAKLDALRQSLKDTEQSIVGLETRELLFEQELQTKRNAVARLEREFQQLEVDNSSKLRQLGDKLKSKRKEHETGLEMTVRLNQQLKETKRECIGLTTRSKLFTEELKKREDVVKTQENTISDVEREAEREFASLRSVIASKEKDRDEWKEKAEGVSQVLEDTKNSIVGLGTRLELFMSQVLQYEESVSNISDKLARKLSFGGSDRALEQELQKTKEQRDDWTQKAMEIERALKEKKSAIPGVETRKSLFYVELEKKNEQVREWKERLRRKENYYSTKTIPLKKALASYILQRDEWRSNTEKVNEILHEKQEQCLPLATELEKCIDQLTKCKEDMNEIEVYLREEEELKAKDVQPACHKLEVQRKDLLHWEDSTVKVSELLNEKRQGIVGLKNRVAAFEYELNKRQGTVLHVEAKISENVLDLNNVIDKIKAEIEREQKERDKIIEMTLERNDELKKLEEVCSSMSVRCKLFENELRNREEHATVLQARFQEKEYDFNAQMKSFNEQVESLRADRDKWQNQTETIVKLLADTEREIVGLQTRLQLFEVEKKNYEEQVVAMEATVGAKEQKTTEEIAPLQNKLQAEVGEHSSWNNKTTEIDDMLKQTKREIIGLNTRFKLFKKELKQKDTALDTLNAKIRVNVQDYAERVGPVVKEYKTQKAELDAWELSTSNIKTMLDKTEAECKGIPNRFDLFRREQKTREDAVAELEAKIKDKEDLVAIQLGFLLNELQLQQKQRGKWKKVTLEMHRLLKETKEQVAALTSQLESNKEDLEEREENLRNLEKSLRDGKDMVAQQLKALRTEIQHQKDLRDELNSTCNKQSRLLEDAMQQCQDLSEKLEESGRKTKTCNDAIEKLEARVAEKKEVDAAQVESIRGQLKIHREQRAEWEENTEQMKQRLKQKKVACVGIHTKLTLLRNLKNGEVHSSLVGDETTSWSNGLAIHLGKLRDSGGNCNEKARAEEDLAARMESLEKELQDRDEQTKEGTESKLESLTTELMNL